MITHPLTPLSIRGLGCSSDHTGSDTGVGVTGVSLQVDGLSKLGSPLGLFFDVDKVVVPLLGST